AARGRTARRGRRERRAPAVSRPAYRFIPAPPDWCRWRSALASRRSPGQRRPVSGGRLVALVGSGAALLALAALAVALPWQGNPHRFLALAAAQSAAYLVAVWSLWNLSSRRIVLGIAAVAALMRLPIVGAPPDLSSDVYRYVWD